MAGSTPGKGKEPQSPLAMLGLGLDAAVAVVVFLFIGYKLDGWWGTTPWMMIAGAFVGMLVGMYSMYRRVMRQQGKQ